MIKLSINVTRIPRERIKPGKNGKYLDLVLFTNKNGADQYGNNGFVKIDVTKEEREAGVQGEIIGNWKELGQKPAAPQRPAGRPAAPADDEEQDIPF